MRAKRTLTRAGTTFLALALLVSLCGCGLGTLFDYTPPEEKAGAVETADPTPPAETAPQVEEPVNTVSSYILEDNRNAQDKLGAAPAIPENKVSYDSASMAVEGTLHYTIEDAYAVTNIYDSGLDMENFGTEEEFDKFFGPLLDDTGTLTEGKLIILELTVENIDASQPSLASEPDDELQYYFIYSQLFAVHIINGRTVGGNIISEGAEYFSALNDPNKRELEASHGMPNGILDSFFRLKPGESRSLTIGYYVDDSQADSVYLFDTSIYTEGYTVLAHVVL